MQSGDGESRQDTTRHPKVKVEPESEAMFIALRLAKKGYYSGNPDNVLKAPIDTVLNIIKFEALENEIEAFYRNASEVQK